MLSSIITYCSGNMVQKHLVHSPLQNLPIYSLTTVSLMLSENDKKQNKQKKNTEVEELSCGKWALTLRGFHGFAILPAPAQWVEVCRHYVAPEVSSSVILVSFIPQQQQLATCGYYISHPVGIVSFRAHTHLQLHAWSQSRLQALVHLRERERHRIINLVCTIAVNSQCVLQLLHN